MRGAANYFVSPSVQTSTATAQAYSLPTTTPIPQVQATPVTAPSKTPPNENKPVIHPGAAEATRNDYPALAQPYTLIVTLTPILTLTSHPNHGLTIILNLTLTWIIRVHPPPTQRRRGSVSFGNRREVAPLMARYIATTPAPAPHALP